MKQTGMLVVLLRAVNFGVWSRLGCSGQNRNIETQNYAKKETEVKFSFKIFYLDKSIH